MGNTEFDNELKGSTAFDTELQKGGVHFLPWIGEQYRDGIYYDKKGEMQLGEDGKGKKILVLGESHYCAREEDGTPDLTRNIIGDYISPENETQWKEKWEPYKNTYTKFERAMGGRPLAVGVEKREFWNHVAFYNYLKKPLVGPRILPNEDDFKISEDAFFTVLNIIEPDYIIVWGIRLYNNLPQVGEQGDDLDVDLETGECYSFETWNYKTCKGKKVSVTGIYHPSSSFDWTFWNKVLIQFVK